MDYPNYTSQYVDSGVRNIELWKKYNPLSTIQLSPIREQLSGSNLSYTLICKCTNKPLNDFFKYSLSTIDTCQDLAYLLNNSAAPNEVDISFFQIHKLKRNKSTRETNDLNHIYYCVMRLVRLKKFSQYTKPVNRQCNDLRNNENDSQKLLSAVKTLRNEAIKQLKAIENKLK